MWVFIFIPSLLPNLYRSLDVHLPDEAEVAVRVKGSCKALQPARVIDDRVQLHAGKQACHVHAQLEQGLQQSGELVHAPCQLRAVRAEQSQDAHWIESSLVSKKLNT